jgi:hypothetical protein
VSPEREIRTQPAGPTHNEQPKTLEQIVDHRSGANIEWRQVRALLEVLGR